MSHHGDIPPPPPAPPPPQMANHGQGHPRGGQLFGETGMHHNLQFRPAMEQRGSFTTNYEGFYLTPKKNIEGKLTWVDVEKQREERSQEDFAKYVKKERTRLGSNAKKYLTSTAMEGNKRKQVELLIAHNNDIEGDQRMEWEVAAIHLEQPSKKQSGSLTTQAKSMTVILKRVPRVIQTPRHGPRPPMIHMHARTPSEGSFEPLPMPGSPHSFDNIEPAPGPHGGHQRMYPQGGHGHGGPPHGGHHGGPPHGGPPHGGPPHGGPPHGGPPHGGPPHGGPHGGPPHGGPPHGGRPGPHHPQSPHPQGPHHQGPFPPGGHPMAPPGGPPPMHGHGGMDGPHHDASDNQQHGKKKAAKKPAIHHSQQKVAAWDDKGSSSDESLQSVLNSDDESVLTPNSSVSSRDRHGRRYSSYRKSGTPQHPRRSSSAKGYKTYKRGERRESNGYITASNAKAIRESAVEEGRRLQQEEQDRVATNETHRHLGQLEGQIKAYRDIQEDRLKDERRQRDRPYRTDMRDRNDRLERGDAYSGYGGYDPANYSRSDREPRSLPFRDAYREYDAPKQYTREPPRPRYEPRRHEDGHGIFRDGPPYDDRDHGYRRR